MAGLAFLGIMAIGVWKLYGPELHARRPKSRMVVSTYRRDVQDGEGRDIKCAPDLELGYMIGISWRLKWFFGIITWEAKR